METRKNSARVRFACSTVVIGLLASLVVFTTQALAQEPKGGRSEIRIEGFSIGGQGAIGRNGPAPGQADCVGPGSAGTISAGSTNSGLVPTTVVGTFTHAAGLLALPGSCVVNIGSCSVVNPATVTFTATIPPGQTLFVSYQAQFGEVAPETISCIVLTRIFDGGTPMITQACPKTTCPAVGPGQIYPSASELSDQKAGSVLIYNLYTSSLTIPGTQNTRISITNVDQIRGVAVHLFFVDGGSCSPIDRYICLTANQTMTFLASEQDPGVTGYIVAVASSLVTGCPINFNHLIGDEFVKFSTGHAANLGAEAIAAIAGGLTFCDANSVTAILLFDGVSYNRVGRVLALDNIPARADGNDTLLVVNPIRADLATGASTIGAIFGLLFDDAEAPHSFSFTAGCQLRVSLSNNFPRVTPRFETVIPAGSTGWLKLWSPVGIALLGAQINFNPNASANAGAFNQGHNLHKLTLSTFGNFIIPIFPPNC